MSLIEGGKITEAAWLRTATILLAVIATLMGVIIKMGANFAETAIDRLDRVTEMVTRHDVDIANMKEEISFLRHGSGIESPAPQNQLRFRGRAGDRKPRGDVPRPPHEPPQEAVKPDDPKPKPKDRDHEKNDILEIEE